MNKTTNLSGFKPTTLEEVRPRTLENSWKNKETIFLYKVDVEHERDKVWILVGKQVSRKKENTSNHKIFSSKPLIYTRNDDLILTKIQWSPWSLSFIRIKA